MAATLDVTFEQDIPKIVRDGVERTSKYDKLLDSIKERAGKIKGKNKVGVLTFDASGKATSRYTSLKTAVSKRDDAKEWKIAVRQAENEDGNTVFNLYLKWDPSLAEETEDEEDEPEETEDEETDDEEEEDDEEITF